MPFDPTATDLLSDQEVLDLCAAYVQAEHPRDVPLEDLERIVRWAREVRFREAALTMMLSGRAAPALMPDGSVGIRLTRTDTPSAAQRPLPIGARRG